MKYSTAKQKLDDMFADKIVKLRKSKYNFNSSQI